MSKRVDQTAETLAAALATLSAMDASDLRVEWRRLYRSHPPKKLSPCRSDLPDQGPCNVLTIPARVKRTGMANKLVNEGQSCAAAKSDRSLL